jgi:DNA modification methylase
LIINGDSLEVLRTMESESVDCVITSPPYWALRDYGVEGQLGLESTFQEYITKLCNIFDEVKRVLKKSGTCWVNLGDTYGTQGGQNRKTDKDYSQYESIKLKNTEIGTELIKEQGYHKCLLQIPSRFAIEMTNRGWILRNEIIWHKPNCMPSSVKDRFTVDFEKVFFFVKNKKYWFEQQYESSLVPDWKVLQRANSKNTSGKNDVTGGLTASKKNIYYEKIRNGTIPIGRNKRAVWRITTKSFKEAHFATFPEDLVKPMILAGCPEFGIVLDIFAGAGTTGLVAKKLNRDFIGIELNPEYIKIAEKRLSTVQEGMF